MSLLKIAPLLKRTKKIVLYRDEEGAPWVGDHCAAYRLYDVPGVQDPKEILSIIGIVDRGQADKFTLMERELPSFQWNDSKVRWHMPVIWRGDMLYILSSNGKILPVLGDYLKPMVQEWKGHLDYCIDGSSLILRSGFMDLAVIRGEPTAADEQFCDELEVMARSFRSEYVLSGDREEKLFDGVTGEVVIHE